MRRRSCERLSPLDAGYLARETDTQPLHFVLEFHISERMTREQVRDHLADRVACLPYLHRMPRYPLVVRRPFWVDDNQFELDRHLSTWEGPLASDHDVDQALNALTTRRLPLDRPLWQLVYGAGPGSSTILWLCLHHAMMDGGMARKTLSDLFGPEPEHVVTPGRWKARRQPPRLLLTGVVLGQGLWRAGRRRLAPPPKTTRAPSRPTVLTGQVSARRALANVTLSLEEVRAVSRSRGLTINDFMLCALTDALRRYLPTPPDEVLCLVPRDVRREEEEGKIGNRGTTMMIALPTGLADPELRQQQIRAASERAKQATETSGAQDYRFDVSLSNVRLGGPFRMVGRAMDGIRTGLPLQGQNRLAVLVTSSLDEFAISITADGDAFPDVSRLAQHMRDAVTAAMTGAGEAR